MFSTCSSIADPLLQENPAFEVPFDPNFTFGSEAANLEYSILSAILGNPSPPRGESTPPPSYSGWPSSDPLSLASQSPTFSSAFPASMTSSQTNLAASPNTTYLSYQYQEPSRSSELSEMQYPQFPQSQSLQPRYPDSRSKSPPLSVFIDESSHGLLSPPHSNASPSLTPTASRPADPSTLACTPGSKLQSINDRVTKPYDYTEGYHFLMKHLPIRCVFLLNYQEGHESPQLVTLVRSPSLFPHSTSSYLHSRTYAFLIYFSVSGSRSSQGLRKMIFYVSCGP